MVCGAGNNCVGVGGGGAVFQMIFHRCDTRNFGLPGMLTVPGFRIAFVDILVLFQ